jgi:uncharacterized protein YceK
MKKLFIILISLLTISGCAQISAVIEKGADANDEALASAEFVICSGASTGSIQRRYNTIELLEARKVICDRNIKVIEP